MKYHDFKIQVSDYQQERIKDIGWVGKFKVWVDSPAGDMAPGQAVNVQFPLRDLQSAKEKLARRDLDRAGLVDFGRTLALLLLPTGGPNATIIPRNLYAESYKMVGPDDGLRLRLILPPELAVYPWEYLYIDRSNSGDGMEGFIALDPRLAIVRHQPLNAPKDLVPLKGDIKVVVALASPPEPGLAPLDIQKEKELLVQAWAQQGGLKPTFLSDATLQDVEGAITGAGIFHFAGHGLFDRNMSATPGEFLGAGSLVFDDQHVEAEQLGINLRGNGVRLAFLGACHAGRSESISWWDGIAPALVKAEIPAVVAYQFTVRDDCAIAFSRQFYQSLVGGMSIEQAVIAGRRAAYNADKEGRDWGNAVLYLRAADGQLFEGAADAVVREEAYNGAEAIISVAAKEVKAGGEVLGAKVGQMLSGKLNTTVVIDGAVYGTVVGATIDRLGGGSANVKTDAETVEQGGVLIGAQIGTIGGPADRRGHDAEPTDGNTLTCPNCGTANRLGDNFCKQCGTRLKGIA